MDNTTSRYETILNFIKGNMELHMGCIVPDDSDTAIKLKVVASELTRLYDQLDFCNKQMFPNTASGEYLEKHGAIKGLFKKRASKSKGKIILKCKAPTPVAIPIPKGTLCTSSKDSSIVFETIRDTVINKNTTSIFTEVESTTTGSNTNLAPHHLDILITPIAGITSVDNVEKTSGGADDEPEEMFRLRVIESFNKISNGANLSYYEQFAKSIPDIWYAKAAFVPNKSNEIELFVENSTHTISDSVISDLQAQIESVRAVGMNVKIKRPVEKLINVDITLKVTISSNSSIYYDWAYEEISKLVSYLKIGERLSPAKIAQKLLEIDSVTDVIINSPTLPVTIAYNEIAALGTINIKVEGETNI